MAQEQKMGDTDFFGRVGELESHKSARKPAALAAGGIAALKMIICVHAGISF
mgnify:CR=1 FL=1